MKQSPKKQPHIVFLFSDTGGGHRSASEAIIEALELEFPGQFSHEMVDFFIDYSPPPLNLAGPIYPAYSRMETLYKFTFDISDDPDRMKVIFSMFWPYVKSHLYRLIEEHPADMYVSVHPLINIPLLRALKDKGIKKPYLVVVTDLVSTHTAWYSNDADRIIIPTQQAIKPALRAGVKPEKLTVIGLPVADRFTQVHENQADIRQRLGWPLDKVAILLVGGGEGMGPLEKVATQINTAGLNAMLAVITGRNKKLKAQLEDVKWQIPAFIYGFVTDMPQYMRAADILISKAGPGTISEALIAELPIILYHRIPGQEEGNVSYVIDEGAGVWAPDIQDIITTLQEWLDHPEKREQAVNQARRLARPDASRQIARMIAETIQA